MKGGGICELIFFGPPIFWSMITGRMTTLEGAGPRASLSAQQALVKYFLN